MASKKKVDDSAWKKYLPYCKQDVELWMKHLKRLEDINHGL